jgi:zinc D-Ala-D-Ala carboxypeptidase
MTTTLSSTSRYVDLQLSTHFKLSEMIRSESAARNGIDNYPKEQAVIENLKALCENVLEPIREEFGKPITPTSGYLCKELNDLIGGTENSQHIRGEAVDFVVPDISKKIVLKYIRQNLTYDQAIDELWNSSSKGWIHVSYKRVGTNRKELFAIPRR